MKPQGSEKLESRGPWLFKNPGILSPGESWRIDFRELKYNGRKRYFRPFLPLDSAQVTNQNTSEPINVTYNGRFETYIVSNAVETFTEQGIAFVRVENAGSTDIAAEEVTLEVSKDAYDAHDEARRNAKQTTPARIVEKFTGIQL